MEINNKSLLDAIHFLDQDGHSDVDILRDWLLVSNLQIGGEPWAELLTTSETDFGIIEIAKARGKVERSKIVGKKIGEKAKKNKIKEVWFDRNGYPYTGRVKAMADAARKTGLKF